MKKSTEKWTASLLSAFVLAVIVSIPQFYIYYLRGDEWNGSTAFLDTDELPYAAYTNALIEGRPRRNDPFSGIDKSKSETLFSIQFLPPYVLALTARAFGLSTNTTFMLLLPVATLAAALCTFWVLQEVTKNTPLAAVGAIGVLSLGTAAAHSPIQILLGIDTGYNFFPFARRYIPGLPFPIVVLSTVFVWRALTKHFAWALLAAISFSILVFSYFFLWTAIAAWFATILLLWFFTRAEDRGRVVKVGAILLSIAVPALILFGWLISQRATNIDQGQLLVETRAPDLFRAPELYGAIIICLIAYQVKKGTVSYRDPRVLFVLSFALTPFFVFNQQVITGLSLQPFHYEEFVCNYWVVLAVFLILGTIRKVLARRVIFYLAVASVGTALMLGIMAARMTRDSNVRLDEVRAVPVMFRDKKLTGVVFASDFRLTNSFATTASNPVLWSRYLYTFANVSSEEQKKRYFQYLYYSGADENRLDHLLHSDFFARWEVFGAERANPILGRDPMPISEDDIAGAVKEYKTFVDSFSSKLAAQPVLSYAVVGPQADLSNLDRWYRRDSFTQSGEFIVYILTLKPHQ